MLSPQLYTAYIRGDTEGSAIQVFSLPGTWTASSAQNVAIELARHGDQGQMIDLRPVRRKRDLIEHVDLLINAKAGLPTQVFQILGSPQLISLAIDLFAEEVKSSTVLSDESVFLIERSPARGVSLTELFGALEDPSQAIAWFGAENGVWLVVFAAGTVFAITFAKHSAIRSANLVFDRLESWHKRAGSRQKGGEREGDASPSREPPGS